MVFVAKKTVHNFLKRIAWLYEQDADIHRIGQYLRKWLQWVFAGQCMGKELKGQGKIIYDTCPDHINVIEPLFLKLLPETCQADKACA